MIAPDLSHAFSRLPYGLEIEHNFGIPQHLTPRPPGLIEHH